MDLVSTLLKSLTSNSSLGALAGKVGVDPDQIEKALSSAIPSLIGSMTKNASSADGAKSLLGALSQHEDDREVSSQIKDADEEDGNKIIGKIMGDDKDDFISSIAKKAGINVGQSNQILSSVAPSVLSSLSSLTKPDSPESIAKEAEEREKAAKSDDEGSFLGGFFKKFMKDEDDKVEEPKKSGKGGLDISDGIDGSDLLSILKNTMM